jgi:hypothetical protein
MLRARLQDGAVNRGQGSRTLSARARAEESIAEQSRDDTTEGTLMTVLSTAAILRE